MPKTLTKGDVVLFALRKCAVASNANATLTDVEPQSIADGLDDLEAMMAKWRALGINVGYLFAEDEHDVSPDDPTGLLPVFKSAVDYQLMLRVLADYGIEPTPRQEATAQTAYDALFDGNLNRPFPQAPGRYAHRAKQSIRSLYHRALLPGQTRKRQWR